MTRETRCTKWCRTVMVCCLACCLTGLATWAGSLLKVGPGQAYTTIQSAVDAATTGDAILVYPSVYAETVAVSTNGISIVAQGAGVTVGPPPAMGQACFDVKADGVMIQGFGLTGTNCAPAIRFVGSHNRFSNNRIYGLTCPGVNALACRDPNGGSNYNTIENNDVSQADLGIVVGSDSSTALNKGNVIVGNHVHDMESVGIVVYNATDSYIAGNIIEGVPYGRGISIIASSGGNSQHGHTVVGNQINGTAEAGIGVFADQKASLSKVTVAYNDIDSPGGIGILLHKEAGAHLAENTIAGNRVSQAQAVGILVDDGVNKNILDGNLVFDSAIYGIQANGNHNKIMSSTALGNGTYDLADHGKGNKWRTNVFETQSWNR